MSFTPKNIPRINYRSRLTSEAGITLIIFGSLILADQYLKTGWLTMTIPFVAGLALLADGISSHRVGFIIAGGLIAGTGAGIFAAFNPWINLDLSKRVGAFLLLHAIGWVFIFLISRWTARRYYYWAIITAMVSGILGIWLWFTHIQPLDLVLYFPTAIGLVLLLCGLISRKIGLVIPGCILLTSGPGVYFAWGLTNEVNGLAQTGRMLVMFALGWGLITVFSKVISNRFVWWPLIPGGVLAMVGWGLYIGGDPNNALSFIGNTGSVGLIIFGIYLLLWRSEFKK